MIVDNDIEGPESLLVYDGKHQPALPFFELEPARPVVTIGRGPTNDLVLPCASVSRRHARLERRGEAWWVCDLSSANGTWVDRERVESARLVRGACLQFGDTSVAFGSDGYCQRLTEPRYVRCMVEGLTQAIPRWRIAEVIAGELEKAQTPGAPLAVAFFDVDHFKRVNETFGHATGDAVLVEVAARIRDRMRERDILGRYGGDELVLLLPGAELWQVVALAEAVRADIARSPVVHGGAVVAITASVGVALAERRDSDPMAAVDRARRSADEARSGGDSRVAG